MPFNYTPVPGNAPAIITLPSDLDDEVAESVNKGLRALADNLMGLAALLGQANTFTAAPLAVNVASAAIAALVTRNVASDDANAANIWKAVLGFNVGTYYVNIYAGRPGAAFQFIIAINAVWDPPSQTWASDDHTAGSIALIMSVGGAVEISHRNAGTGTWTTWPVNGGDLNIGGAASIAGALVALSGAFGVGGVSTSGAFVYGPLKPRTSIINISECCGNVVRNSDGSISNTSTGKVAWKVRLPKNATFGDIQIMHTQATADGNAFGLVTRLGADWSTPAGPTVTTPVTAAGPSSIGTYVTTLSTSGLTFDTSTDEAEIVWQLTNTSATANKVMQIRMVNWQDNGPFNDL